MNSRAKGGRTFRKAVKYALTFKKTAVIPIYQISRYAQPQPFDLLLLREDYLPRLVEVRSNQWGTGKPSTVQLSNLPGIAIKQIWRFKDGESVPDVRTWNEQGEWLIQDGVFDDV